MKGFALDILFGMVFVVVIIMALTIGTMMLNTVSDSSLFDSNPTANASISHAQTGLSVMDDMVVLIAIGVGLGAVVTAFFVDSNPLLFIVFVLLNVVMWTVLAPLSNVMESFLLSDSISATTNDIPISLLVIQYMPIASIIFGFLVAIMSGIPRGRG